MAYINRGACSSLGAIRAALSLLFFGFLIGCETSSKDSSRGPVDTSDVLFSFGWSFSQDTVRSEMDDSTRLMNQNVMLMGQRSVGRDSSEPALLNASCRDHQLSVLLTLGPESDANRPVRMRVDSAPPENLTKPVWFIANARGATAAIARGRNARQFLKRLERATWLRIEYQPNGEAVPSLVKLKVAGLSKVSAPLYAACP
jgi:hypothetical protein